MINPHIFVLSIAALVAVYMHFKKETREMELEFKYNRHKSYDKFGRVVYINDDEDDFDDVDEPKRVKMKKHKSCNGYRRYL